MLVSERRNAFNRLIVGGLTNVWTACEFFDIEVRLELAAFTEVLAQTSCEASDFSYLGKQNAQNVPILKKNIRGCITATTGRRMDALRRDV